MSSTDAIRASFNPSVFDIKYEEPLPVLENNPPATLDAYLTSSDDHSEYYFELKMFEWLFPQTSSIKQAYFVRDNYLIFEDYADVFISVLKDLTTYREDQPEHRSRFERYDALQMFKHTLGIFTKISTRDFVEAQDEQPWSVRLINGVWEVENPSKLGKWEQKYREAEDQEHAEFNSFRDKMIPIVTLFDQFRVDFDIEYWPTSKIVDFQELLLMRQAGLERYRI